MNDSSMLAYVGVSDLLKQPSHVIHVVDRRVDRREPLEYVIDGNTVIDAGDLREAVRRGFDPEVPVPDDCITTREGLLQRLEANYVVPAAFTDAVRSGSIKGPESQVWSFGIDDIERVRTATKMPFVAAYSISYEDAGSEHEEFFPWLSDARERLSDEGALEAVPGNAALIRLGSQRLYSSTFESDGFDRGDSHISPRTTSKRDSLYRQIIAQEREILPSSDRYALVENTDDRAALFFDYAAYAVFADHPDAVRAGLQALTRPELYAAIEQRFEGNFRAAFEYGDVLDLTRRPLMNQLRVAAALRAAPDAPNEQRDVGPDFWKRGQTTHTILSRNDIGVAISREDMDVRGAFSIFDAELASKDHLPLIKALQSKPIGARFSVYFDGAAEVSLMPDPPSPSRMRLG